MEFGQESTEQFDNLENNEGYDQQGYDQETQQEVGTQDYEQAESETFDYKKDKRYGAMWKDENDIYKSYRNMEKTYNPIKSKLDTYNQLYEQYGVSDDNLEEVFKEYHQLKDPETPLNQWATYLNKWLSNEIYQPKVVEMFRNLEKEETRRKWGENVPDEIVEKLERMEELERKVQERERAEEESKQQEKLVGSISQGMNEVREYAAKHDLVFDQKLESEFIDYCIQQNVDPNYILDRFIRLSNEYINNNIVKKTQDNTIKNVVQSKKAGIIVNAPKSENTQKGSSFKQDLTSIINRMYGSNNG